MAKRCKLGIRRDGKCRRVKCPRKLTRTGLCPSSRKRTAHKKRSVSACCAACVRSSRKRRSR